MGSTLWSTHIMPFWLAVRLPLTVIAPVTCTSVFGNCSAWVVPWQLNAGLFWNSLRNLSFQIKCYQTTLISPDVICLTCTLLVWNIWPQRWGWLWNTWDPAVKWHWYTDKIKIHNYLKPPALLVPNSEGIDMKCGRDLRWTHTSIFVGFWKGKNLHALQPREAIECYPFHMSRSQ